MGSKQPVQLTPLLLLALRLLGAQETPLPMRKLAKWIGVRPQVLALRVWRLRLKGLADKPGDKQYVITEAGKQYLAEHPEKAGDSYD